MPSHTSAPYLGETPYTRPTQAFRTVIGVWQPFLGRSMFTWYVLYFLVPARYVLTFPILGCPHIPALRRVCSPIGDRAWDKKIRRQGERRIFHIPWPYTYVTYTRQTRVGTVIGDGQSCSGINPDEYIKIRDTSRVCSRAPVPYLGETLDIRHRTGKNQ